MGFRQTLGKAAEEAAWASFRGEPGAYVLQRNFRTRRGEVDLIAVDGRDLVFIEVRRRTQGGWVGALESVTPQKRQRLEHCARAFLAFGRVPKGVKAVRFDVIATDGVAWRHIRRAWH